MRKRLGACVLAVSAMGWAEAAAATGTTAAEGRHDAVGSVIDKWRHDADSRGYDLAAWEAQWERILTSRSEADIAAALKADSYDGMRAAVGLGPVEPDALGDPDQDLVFTPLAPCRILATDVAIVPYAGRLVPGVVRHFFHNADIGAQGGNPAGCGVPDDAVALVAKISTFSPLNWGLVNAWAYSQPQPPDNVLAYDSNALQHAATTTVLPVCQGCGFNFSAMVGGPGAAHVHVEVLGYFRRPAATPLACSIVRQPIIAASSTTAFSWFATCPTGAIVTGGGFEGVGSRLPGLEFIEASPVVTSTTSAWRCRAVNNSGVVVRVNCHAVCCTVPGR